MAATAQSGDELPRWLTISGAALWVSLSAKTIRRKIAAGELPCLSMWQDDPDQDR